MLDKKFPTPLVKFDGTIDKELRQCIEHEFINKVYDGVLVGHVYSKGGCVMGRRDNIIRCNGYNPMFVGWGYEDDEFPFRISNLGYDVGRKFGVREPCWHLHHFDGTGSKKETQEFHDDNNREVMMVQQMDKEQLEQYKKTWRL